MSSLELIKIVIQSIEKKLRKDDFKNKAQEKIQSILLKEPEFIGL